MRERLSKIYNLILYIFFLILPLYTILSCTQEENTETIEVSDIIPEATGDYNYTDSSESQEVELDPLSIALFDEFGNRFQDNQVEVFGDSWTFIPDRVQTDSSFNKVFELDSSAIQLKSWYFSDSLRTINALYNWLDCFGSKCQEVSIADSINVSSESFILLQNNTQLHFVRGEENLNFNNWKKFFGKIITEKNSWNLIIQQRNNDILSWIISEEATI